MLEGYIKLYRKIQEHPLYPANRPKRDWTGYEALTDLIFSAHYSQKSKRIVKNGKVIEITRGQIDVTQRQLADKWHWSLDKVNRFIKYLKRESTLREIPNESQNKHFTVLEVVNYDIYNPLSEQDQEQDPNKIRTLKNKRKKGIKEINKEKKLYGSLVSLSDSEHSELVKLMGNAQLESLIERMNNYCLANGKTYKSYAAALRNWFMDAVDKGKMFLPKAPEPKKSPGVSEWSEEQRAIYARRKAEVFGKLNQVTQ